MESKRCIACDRDLPATREFFTPLAAGKYGLHPRCKTCRAKAFHQYYTNNREKHIQVVAAYRKRIKLMESIQEQKRVSA